MHASKNALRKTGMEEPPESLEALVVRSQPVTVPYQAAQPVVREVSGKPVHGQAQLRLKVAERPEIVVAYVEMDGNTRIGDPGQSALNADAALGNGALVFEPEIEQIPHDVNGRSAIGCRSFDPSHERSFTFPAFLPARGSEMNV